MGDFMELPQRKPTRVKNFDYNSPGAYFVTICTENKKHILSRITTGEITPNTVGDGSPVPQLTQSGLILKNYIESVNTHFPNARVEKYVIMPNHFHMIVVLDSTNGTGDPSPTLGNIVAWIKYNATKDINNSANTSGIKIFQRSYHDHIIRNEKDYTEIYTYIENNPAKWAEDCYYQP